MLLYRDSQGVETNIAGTNNTMGQQALNDIASEFSDSISYAVGDYCIYEGQLYRCIIQHTQASWAPSHFTATNVGNEANMLFNNCVAKKATSTSNANDYKSNGVYFTQPGWTNLPAEMNYGTLVCFFNNQNEGGQLFFSTTGYMKLYFRNYSADTWRAWQTVTSN